MPAVPKTPLIRAAPSLPWRASRASTRAMTSFSTRTVLADDVEHDHGEDGYSAREREIGHSLLSRLNRAAKRRDVRKRLHACNGHDVRAAANGRIGDIEEERCADTGGDRQHERQEHQRDAIRL